jgi:hypothetical protein
MGFVEVENRVFINFKNKRTVVETDKFGSLYH